MGYFDDLITQENSKYIPIWRYVADIAEKYQSTATATIEYLRHFDIPVYAKNGLAEYNLLKNDFFYSAFACKVTGLHDYIDSVSNQLDTNILVAKTKENPYLFKYLKISELPTLPIPNIETIQKDHQQMGLAGNDVSKVGLSDLNHQAIIDDLTYQLNQAHARIAELEKQPNKYQNQALQALHDVINEFWQDPSNPPKQEFIKAYIMENYSSIEESKALWIDKIIRHKDK